MPKLLLVAVVEDDGSFRDSMSMLLSSFGYSVEAFASAADFLASHSVKETACLIADVNMPDMTGIELYERLVVAGHAIPTILVTAYPNDDDRAFFAGVIGGGSVVGERLPFRIVVYRCVNTVMLNFRGKAIHSEREYVHKPAQEVDVRARLRRARACAQADHRQGKQDAEK